MNEKGILELFTDFLKMQKSAFYFTKNELLFCEIVLYICLFSLENYSTRPG